MALSTLSFGMLTARAFWMARFRAGFASGFGPEAFTAMVISLPMRANALDILSQRANIVCLRVSKIRPMVISEGGKGGGREFGRRADDIIPPDVPPPPRGPGAPAD